MSTSRGPKRGSGVRTGHWATSKSSNLGWFNPYRSEALEARWSKPDHTVAIHNTRIRVCVRPLHQDFLRPFSTADVESILRRLPSAHAATLKAVCLLGGNKAQLKTATGPLFVYGCYWEHAILLHAFPRTLTVAPWNPPPKPSVRQQYERCGARFEQSGSILYLSFSQASLRRWYLFVLLHELGHHVVRSDTHRNYDREERFADQFATELASDLVRVSHFLRRCRRLAGDYVAARSVPQELRYSITYGEGVCWCS